MKNITLTLILVFCNIYSNAQMSNTFSKQELRLIHIIRQSPLVESECIALFCYQKSVLYAQADSLFKSLSHQKTKILFNDPSYILKYYAFQRLVKINELEAANSLTSVLQDSTKVAFHFDDFAGEDPFNKILANEYEQFIYLKYFNQNNPKHWIAKQRQLCKLYAQANIKTHYQCP